MEKDIKLNSTEIEKNIKAVQKFLNEKDLDIFYISSTDQYLNEYVPRVDCHRYYFTGFTGSTAELFIPKKGRAILYVDGRYHEQVDLEIDPKLVEAVKCPHGVGLRDCMGNTLQELKIKTIGIEGDRTPKDLESLFSKTINVSSFNNGELSEIVEFEKLPSVKDVYSLPVEVCGKSPKDKIKEVLEDGEAIFITALDSIAWLTNCRGFHLPSQSSFLGKVFATHNSIYVFVDKATPVRDCAQNIEGVKFEFVNYSEMKSRLDELNDKSKFSKVYCDSKQINNADYGMIFDVFGESVLEEKSGGLVAYHSIKNATELKEMKGSFNKADQAIFNSMKWLKGKVSSNESVSELDFYNQANLFYKETGAIDQSFNTIAAVGANSSQIHFSASSADTPVNEGDLVLLDSGALYENGFSTDTTRTFLSGGEANEQQKQIYTLVLKGLLQSQALVVADGTWGMIADSFARAPIMKAGFDYAHGTGHGVGINVHESGISFSPKSNMPIKEGQVVSIEPGIYLPGVGGVRLENVIAVEKHPEFEGKLYFKQLVYIGYDHDLINFDLLTNEEVGLLEEYEKECKRRGTSLKS